MLYLTYAANFKNLTSKQKQNTLLIARGLKEKSFPGAKKEINLAPSKELLEDYKSNLITFSEFKERFSEQMESMTTFKELRKLYVRIKNGENIILCCYEKDNKICHRRLIAEYLEKNGGIKWEEL